MIEKDTDLYNAIEVAMVELFENTMPLDCPFETAEIFIKHINDELKRAKYSK